MKKTEQRYSLAHAQLITNLWHLFFVQRANYITLSSKFCKYIYLSIFVFYIFVFFCTFVFLKYFSIRSSQIFRLRTN